MRKRLILNIICIMTFFVGIVNVSAGTVTVGFTGNDTVVVNNNIDVMVYVDDISGLTDGLATAQGDISFDSTYLEFVKYEDLSSELSVSYGTKTKRFVALGLSGEYISSSDNLLKLTFKAKTVGETTLGINDVVIGDTKAIIHSSNVVGKTIKIVDEGSSEATSSSAPVTNSGSNSSSGSSSKSSSANTKTTKSSDATLSSLLVNNAKVSPSFNKDVTEYSVVVSSDVSKLQLEYETTQKNASVSVVGNTELKDNGTSVVKVVVTAEDGTTKTYTLNVTKSKEENDNKLKSLKVKESSLSFDEDKYEYNITVGKDVDKLTVKAIPKNKNSKVEIIGNKNLSNGNNVVLIKLTSKEGYTNYYKLNVKKDDTVRLFGIDVRWIIFFLLLLLLLLLLIIILLKRRKKDEEEDKNIKKNDTQEVLKNYTPHLKSDEENVDIYDDVVTKEELIDAIKEKNPKKLRMLLVQEQANKLKEELIEEEKNN